MEKLDDLARLKHRLIDFALQNTTDLSNVRSDELGDVTDMIKDLAEAEEKCVKACYYARVIDAMDQESGEDGRMGYDRWRYSSGRFAPKGHGHITHNMGFNSGDHPPMFYDNMPTEDNFQRWKDARRHYTESGMKKDKEVMDGYAKTHLSEVMCTLKEIMANSDTDLQKKMKNELTNLINDTM